MILKKCLISVEEMNSLILKKNEKTENLLKKKQNKYIYIDDKFTNFDSIEIYNRISKNLFINFYLFINQNNYDNIQFKQITYFNTVLIVNYYIYANNFINNILNNYLKLNNFYFNNNFFFNINITETSCNKNEENYVYMTTKNLTNSETLDFILGSDKLSLYHILNYNYKYYFKSFNMYNFIKNNIMTLNNIQKRLKYNSYSWLLT